MQMNTQRSRGAIGTGRARFTRRLLGLAAIAGLSLASASTAQANPISRDWGHGGVTQSHLYVYACDDSRDGRGVFVQYIGVNNPTLRGIDHVLDDSSAGGCVQEYTTKGRIINFRLCREGSWAFPVECTGWAWGTPRP